MPSSKEKIFVLLDTINSQRDKRFNPVDKCMACGGALHFYGDYHKNETEYHKNKNKHFDYMTLYQCENCETWYEMFHTKN